MLAVRLFGSPPTTVIAQTPTFPRGEVDGAPFQTFWQDTTNFDLCPEESVLVRGVVLARGASTDADDPTVVNFESARWSTFTAIKLRVHSCSSPPNHTMIDADRQIVMKGNVSIEVLGPSTWFDRKPADPEGMIEVAVHVVACPVRCCYPPVPHLTFWRQIPATTNSALRSFIRPRGARRLLLTNVPAGVTNLSWWMAASGGTLLGAQPITPSAVFPSPTPTEIVGSPDEVSFEPQTTAAGQLFMRWEIEG